jgi:hypothetical protein
MLGGSWRDSTLHAARVTRLSWPTFRSHEARLDALDMEGTITAAVAAFQRKLLTFGRDLRSRPAVKSDTRKGN